MSPHESVSSRYVTFTDLEGRDRHGVGGATSRVPETPRSPMLTAEALSQVIREIILITNTVLSTEYIHISREEDLEENKTWQVKTAECWDLFFLCHLN